MTNLYQVYDPDYLSKVLPKNYQQNQLPVVNTGGTLPPQQVPTVNTGGTLPPQQLVAPNMSSPTPPQLVPTMNTGGNQPPVQMPTVNTGGNLPPNQIPSTQQTIQLAGLNLPGLDGSQFVANLQPGNGPGQSPGSLVGELGGQFNYQGGDPRQAVQQMIQQFGYQPGQDPTALAQQIASAFNTTPDKLPIEVVQQIQAAFAGQQLPSASQTTMGFMDDLLNKEGSYITNARRRGLEQANSRGMMNSSIAAGASQRSALEAAQPILNQIMGLNNQREGQDFQARQNAINQAFGLTQNRENQQFQRDMTGMGMAHDFASQDKQAAIRQAEQAISAAMQLEGQARDAALAQARDQFSAAMNLTGQREQNAFTGQQSALDRTQGVNNMLLGHQMGQQNMQQQNYYSQQQAVLDAQLRQNLMKDTTLQQDWLASRSFTREFNGALSMMPIKNAFDLNNQIMQYAAENPEVYTPDIISGMTNFLQMNMTAMLQQYFPTIYGGGGGGG